METRLKEPWVIVPGNSKEIVREKMKCFLSEKIADLFYKRNSAHFLWVHRCNKRTLDAGRRQEELANHEPVTSDLHAFLRVSSQLLAKNVVYC